MPSNEELAVQIKQGRSDLMPELWQAVELFVQARANAFIRNYGSGGAVCGHTVDDLKQLGFFALIRAVAAFDPAAGFRLTTYLGYHLRTVWADACYYHGGQARRPLDHCASLDSPLSDDDGGTLADLVPDQDSMIPFEAVEDDMQTEVLHRLLDEALNALPEEQATILRQRYYEQQTLRAIADARGCAIHRVRDKAQQGISAIRRNGPVKRRLQAAWMECQVDELTNYYKGGSGAWFVDQERIVEVLAERRAKILQQLRKQ